MAKLFKRGRIWFARVPKRGGGTRKVSTLCTDKRAAESVLATLEREAVDPAFAASNRTTTQTILDDYYVSKKIRGRATASLAFVFKKSKHLVRLLPRREGQRARRERLPLGWDEEAFDARRVLVMDLVRRTVLDGAPRIFDEGALRAVVQP